MALNSAPPVLRTPAVLTDSASGACSEEVYPWVASTPERSPVWPSISLGEENCFPSHGSFAQLALPVDFVRTVCEPCFEEIHCCVQQGHTGPMVSRDMLRVQCEPFFDKMIVALQQAVQQQMQGNVNDSQSIRAMTQADVGACFQTVFYPNEPFLGLDEESTDADDAGAFASIFCVSSEGEGVMEKKDSEPEVEKSVMVCRHWKSKGWCRMESKCKFLHPEHKRGISGCDKKVADGALMNACSSALLPGGAECMVLPTTSARRRKKAGQSRATTEQLGFDAQNSPPLQPCSQQSVYFPCISAAPGVWLDAGDRSAS